jgi:hypothetical protein
MLNIFGQYGGIIGLVVIIWVFYVGFLVKKLVKVQEETNRLLRNLGNTTTTPAAGH